MTRATDLLPDQGSIGPPQGVHPCGHPDASAGGIVAGFLAATALLGYAGGQCGPDRTDRTAGAEDSEDQLAGEACESTRCQRDATTALGLPGSVPAPGPADTSYPCNVQPDGASGEQLASALHSSCRGSAQPGQERSWPISPSVSGDPQPPTEPGDAGFSPPLSGVHREVAGHGPVMGHAFSGQASCA